MRRGEVLVAGAGPVGLAAALELTRRGVPVRIVDRSAGYHVQSRALGINPRTLELLEASGVTARLLDEGLRLTAVEIHTGRGDPRVVPFDLRHRYGFILLLPQSRTERILGEALAERGVEVAWERPVTDVELEAGGAPVVTVGPGGETLRPDFLVGADGARSVTRGGLGIGWPLEVSERGWGLLDGRFDPPFPTDRAWIRLGPEGPLAALPMPGGVTRLVWRSGDPLARIPGGMRLVEEVWRSAFDLEWAVAATVLRGRAALVGDAAHVHSPVGARGMNLGIEDAVLLARVLPDGGREGLERWARGRERRARQVVAQVRAATRGVSATSAPARALRGAVLGVAARVGPLRRAGLRRIAGLDLDLPPA